MISKPPPPPPTEGTQFTEEGKVFPPPPKPSSNTDKSPSTYIYLLPNLANYPLRSPIEDLYKTSNTHE
jgi:hypothetical protein